MSSVTGATALAGRTLVHGGRCSFCSSIPSALEDIHNDAHAIFTSALQAADPRGTCVYCYEPADGVQQEAFDGQSACSMTH